MNVEKTSSCKAYEKSLPTCSDEVLKVKLGQQNNAPTTKGAVGLRGVIVQTSEEEKNEAVPIKSSSASAAGREFLNKILEKTKLRSLQREEMIRRVQVHALMIYPSYDLVR